MNINRENIFFYHNNQMEDQYKGNNEEYKLLNNQ